MNHQVSMLSRSVNLTLKNLSSVRHMLTDSAASTLIHSLVMSKIDSCNSLYLGMSAENMCSLQKLQNAAMRYITRSHPSVSVSEHFRNEHWLNIHQRICFKYLVIIFKCINCFAPIPLQRKISLRCPERMVLETSTLYPRTTYGRRSFSYMAPRMWNALPLNCRIIAELDPFKVSIKTYLFDNMNTFLRRVNPFT